MNLNNRNQSLLDFTSPEQKLIAVLFTDTQSRLDNRIIRKLDSSSNCN